MIKADLGFVKMQIKEYVNPSESNVAGTYCYTGFLREKQRVTLTCRNALNIESNDLIFSSKKAELFSFLAIYFYLVMAENSQMIVLKIAGRKRIRITSLN